MRCKGLVIVPAESPSRRANDDPGATRRIANRPIVCHVLDGLVAAGVDELAVVAPVDLAPEIRSCIDADSVSTPHTKERCAGRTALRGTRSGRDQCNARDADLTYS